MPTNKDFLRRLGAKQATFYLADFHVHSPASHDFQGEQKVDSSSEEIPTNIRNSVGTSALNPKAKHEAIVQHVQSPAEFYDALVAHKNDVAMREGMNPHESWAFVAITDHDVCRYSARLSEYAWDSERRSRDKLIVLPGIELSVDFPVPGTTLEASVHLLLIFQPLTTSEHIYSTIKNASNTNWEFGETLQVHRLPDFVDGIRNNSSHPGICIAAHVGSSKGVREETKQCLLTHNDAEISRIEGELALATQQQRAVLEEKLDQLKSRRTDPNQIPLEVLHLLGMCGFDALQTRGSKDEMYYRRLHRFRESFGRSVSIVCSDAHRVNAVFSHQDEDSGNNLIPYIKLSQVSAKSTPTDLFERIKHKSLRFGETRTTHRSPQHISSWIEGIEIIPDAEDSTQFWPFDRSPDGIPRGFTARFSQNLNCVIGGRGSGKSALVEALTFLSSTGSSSFTEKGNRNSDWYLRAAATLRGCRIRICWRILVDSGSSLPKRALFAERYFDGDHTHSALTLWNVDGQEQLPGTVELPSIQVFRIHDIEDAAKPERLRKLFDDICGKEVARLCSEIDTIIIKLQKQRSAMVKIASDIAALTRDDNPLRQYARRKMAYDKVNKPEIREQFKKIDQISGAQSVATTIEARWSEVQDEFDIEGQKARVSNFFISAFEMVLDKPSSDEPVAVAKPYCSQLHSAIEGRSSNDPTPTSAEQRLLAALDGIGEECGKLTSDLRESRTKVEAAHKSARDSLASQGHPTGSSDRETKKLAFEQAEASLETYRTLWAEWDRQEVERRTLFDELKSLAKLRTEVRQSTAEKITRSLANDLDPSILRIEADAQPLADVSKFADWLLKEIQWRTSNKPRRFEKLAKNILPAALRDLLICKEKQDSDQLTVDGASAADGRISSVDAATIVKQSSGYSRLDPEVAEDGSQEWRESLPSEISDGLWTFATRSAESSQLMIDALLRLDEVVLDDLPVIRLNDRPNETTSLKPLERLSPGQRCTAILPILLLNGTYPLIIDQPEDNLDTRLIRQVVVNILSSIKLRRQVIVATHNPNIPVLGDAEHVIVLRAVADEQCEMEVDGDLDDQKVVRSITEIMEGGREAFQYRHSVYHVHWDGGADGT